MVSSEREQSVISVAVSDTPLAAVFFAAYGLYWWCQGWELSRVYGPEPCQRNLSRRGIFLAAEISSVQPAVSCVAGYQAKRVSVARNHR